ncbi:MAG: serine/threonine protein kinase [Lachnospiraceae bacterium]|nr:serine/threonine protein kinase [Lachnospiraceae bacterium]
MAEVGQVINNKYEILKLVGKGGMSRVYLAMDMNIHKPWAVKEIDKTVKDKNNEVVIQSAIAEANLIKELDHNAIVRIVDIIDEPDKIFIIEDFIDGETLNSIVLREGAQPQEKVIEWAIQICSALEYLHTRKPPIIYRDMKPANVMLKPEGNVKIIDFGIAREYKEQNTEDTKCLGTKGYAAPEQFGGKGQTDARTDVYCLGVTLYYLVTGKNPSEPPYEIYPIRHWNPRLSSGLEAIILKCTRPNPADRFQSCAELNYALQHYEEYTAQYRVKQLKKVWKFSAAVVAAILFIIAGCFGLGMRSKKINSDFTLNMNQAVRATNEQEKEYYYRRAIAIKPGDVNPYLGIIEMMKKNDVKFDEEEEKELLRLIETNQEALKRNPEYSKLAFEIGKLYWFYYTYGAIGNSDDNEMTRRGVAVEWFNDAVAYGQKNDDYYRIADVYRQIGEFLSTINLKIKEGSDGGAYGEYWNCLREIVSTITDKDSEVVVLEIYRQVINAIIGRGKGFRNDGISYNEISSMLDKVTVGLNNCKPIAQTNIDLKEDILAKVSDARAAIERDYEKGGAKAE